MLVTDAHVTKIARSQRLARRRRSKGSCALLSPLCSCSLLGQASRRRSREEVDLIDHLGCITIAAMPCPRLVFLTLLVSTGVAFHRGPVTVTSRPRTSSSTFLSSSKSEAQTWTSSQSDYVLSSSRSRRSDLPPPPCPKSNPSDDLFRNIRRSWPVWLQNWLCESGVVRAVSDSLIYVGIPGLIREYPESFWDFFHLSTSSAFVTSNDTSRARSRISKIQYGSHKSQFVDLIEPTRSDSPPPNGTVAFVHGGAWGSGQPWMYRLVALPFLAQNKAVAIIGYRTYPDADVNGQVEDVGSALNALARERPDLLDNEGRIESLIGHSSGAHISLLHILETAKRTLRDQDDDADMTPIGRYVAISGVYCISSHYEYEKGRGVDQVSALRVACGPGTDGFKEASPAYRLECIAKAEGGKECILVDDEDDSPVVLDDHVPELMFVHGVDDNVVQYTQCCKVVDSIRSALSTPDRCKEILLEDVGHADTVLHLMVGGATREIMLS